MKSDLAQGYGGYPAGETIFKPALIALSGFPLILAA
jgi:hypothetical protein